MHVVFVPLIIRHNRKVCRKNLQTYHPRDATPILHIRGANLQKQVHRYFSLKGPLIEAVKSSFGLRSSANKVDRKCKGSKLFSEIFASYHKMLLALITSIKMSKVQNYFYIFIVILHDPAPRPVWFAAAALDGHNKGGSSQCPLSARWPQRSVQWSCLEHSAAS